MSDEIVLRPPAVQSVFMAVFSVLFLGVIGAGVLGNIRSPMAPVGIGITLGMCFIAYRYIGAKIVLSGPTLRMTCTTKNVTLDASEIDRFMRIGRFMVGILLVDGTQLAGTAQFRDASGVMFQLKEWHDRHTGTFSVPPPPPGA